MNALTTQLPQTAPNEKSGYTMLDIVFMSVFAVLLVFFGASAAYAFQRQPQVRQAMKRMI